MNKRTLTIAKGFGIAGADGDVVHIYDDGLVVAIHVPTDRHLQLREIIHSEYADVGEARVGELSVFCVPMPSGWDRVVPGMFKLITSGYSTHHDEPDCHNLDQIYALMKAILADWEKNEGHFRL